MEHSQSGNVLFYILIAVGLLAALSYTVAQSSRGNVETITDARAGLYATEIIEYGNTLANATSQLRLRGYKGSEVSFENDTLTDYINPNCTTDSCKIFHINGLGILYLEPKPVWLDEDQSASSYYGEYYFTGESNVEDVRTDDDELIMFLPYIKKALCIAINEKLSINPAPDETPSESSTPFDTGHEFKGVFGDVLDETISGDATSSDSEILHNTTAGCTQNSSDETYHFYQVLLAR